MNRKTICMLILPLILAGCDAPQESGQNNVPVGNELPVTENIAQDATLAEHETYAANYTDELTTETLSMPASPHWVFIRDVNFFNLVTGSVRLIDADTGAYLGMITTGSAPGFALSPDSTKMYMSEGYYSRYVRGDYIEVVSIYDVATLSPIGEVTIPPKRSQNLLHHNMTSITDNGRFVLVLNITPAASVSVVDVENQQFVQEISTGGCAHVFPTSDTRFSMICGDGTALTVSLAEDGSVASSESSEVFFDADKDPLLTRGARDGNQWYFTTYSGDLHTMRVDGAKASTAQAWRLMSDSDYDNGWRPGGLQPIAVSNSGALYVLMNQNGEHSHKDPGHEIWIFDVDSKQRIRRMELEEEAFSIQVSADDETLLYTLNVETGVLNVYDPASGQLLRSKGAFSDTPVIMHVPQ